MKLQKVSRAFLQAWPLPSAAGSASKEDRGRVVVVGGSRRVPGAVLLAGEAALRAGAGKLMVMTAEPGAASLGIAMPECAVVGVPVGEHGELNQLDVTQVDLVRHGRVVLVGPGMATGASLAPAQAVRAASAVVIDAGALHADVLAEASGPRILTPHVPEMADLMSTTPAEVAARPMEFATAAARKFGAIVVLKGPATWISDAEGHLWLHEVDAPGLGTSGSGDVLAGLITGLLARGAEPVQAAAWGVAVHARAGQMAAREIGHVGFLARELLGRIPRVLERLERH